MTQTVLQVFVVGGDREGIACVCVGIFRAVDTCVCIQEYVEMYVG